MPLQATGGAASYDAFGGGVPVVPTYIEDIFSCFLYTGNGSTQTITNGIDLSTKGGLVWTKSRTNAYNNALYDTVRGVNNRLFSNTTGAVNTASDTLTAFNTNGFTLGANDGGNFGSGSSAVSWTFRKQPKFFDVVTYTGNGGTPQNIAHSLGSVPGFIVVKPTSTTGGWICYHRSLTASGFNPAPYNTINLNSTGSILEDTGAWNSTAPTSTVFTIGSSPDVNTNGATYVAYLFAHDAGGFGLTGTDNVISCGSYTGNGSADGPSINLGYEAQYVLIKRTDNPASWFCQDNMRGMSQTQTSLLVPNTSAAEDAGSLYVSATATGFKINSSFSGFNSSSATYIYIAIRRGPMKVPTVGTSVYNNLANRVGTSATATISGVGFPVDLMLPFATNTGSVKPFVDRLRGATKYLLPPYSNAEQTETNVVTSFASNDGVIVGADSLDVINNYYNGDRRYAASFFRRAPSVFDIVCYTGNGSTQNVNHNLGVAPELMIVKSRSLSDSDWWVYASALTTPQNKYLRLQSTDGESTATGLWGSSLPTSTTFGLGAFSPNSSGATFVAYLFATCAGVSKVGSYTGTGALQTVNCGFTSGARFILIKRTNSTGDWWLYDSARGISSGNDPYLLLNTTGASELGTNYVDTDSTGFKVTAAAPAGLNASGGTYIFLAFA